MKTQLKFALLLTAVLLSACNKKVKEETVNPNAGNTTSGQTNPGDQGSAIVEEGAFGPSDLDSNTCLRQRVVYFDYDQDMLKQLRAAQTEIDAGDTSAFLKAKMVACRYYLDIMVPEAFAFKGSAMAGADLLYALDAEDLAA